MFSGGTLRELWHEMSWSNVLRIQYEDMRPLEQGIMFHAEQQKGAEIKKGAANLTYWVVG